MSQVLNFFSHAPSPAAFWFLPLEFLDIGPPRTLLEFSLLFSPIVRPLSFILLCGDFNFTFQTFSLCQHCHLVLTFLQALLISYVPMIVSCSCFKMQGFLLGLWGFSENVTQLIHYILQVPKWVHSEVSLSPLSKAGQLPSPSSRRPVPPTYFEWNKQCGVCVIFLLFPTSKLHTQFWIFSPCNNTSQRLSPTWGHRQPLRSWYSRPFPHMDAPSLI